MKRVPRNIDIKKESELQECERMMQNYITLLRISSRSLKRAYIKIDEKMPMIGSGLTASDLSDTESREDIINKDADEIWANHIENIQKMENEKDGSADVGVEQYLNNFKAKGITVRGASPIKDERDNLRSNSGMVSLKARLSKIKSKIDTKNPLAYQKRGNSSVLTPSASASSLKNEKTNTLHKTTNKGSKDVKIFKKKNILSSRMTFIRSTEDMNEPITEEGKLIDDPFENSEKDLSNSIKAEILPKTVKEFEPDTEEIKNELTKQSLEYISEQEKRKNDPNKKNENDKNVSR